MKKTMALFIHCLDMTGGVFAVFSLVQAFDKQKYDISIISDCNGYMKNKFEEIGCSVIIKENMEEESFIKKIVDDYDVLWVNSLILSTLIEKLNQLEKTVYWWIHECPSYFLVNEQTDLASFWRGLNSNIHVLSAGKFVQDFIKQRYSYLTKILDIAIEDVSNTEILDCNVIANPNKISFLCAASTYMPIKGQDILALAIVQLPREYWERCEFFFVGDENAGKLELYEMTLLAAKMCQNVYTIPMLERESLMQLMKQCDCVIVPSREDATNTCAVEGLCMSKPCIISDMAGVSRYVDDGVNGYVFQSEVVAELIEKIKLVIDQEELRRNIGVNAKYIYKKYFSLEAMKRNLKDLAI